MKASPQTKAGESPSSIPVKMAPRDRAHEMRQIGDFKSQLRLLGHPVGDNLSTLGMMQHYGAKTRLLDFSFSPYVATYFAFEREESFAERVVYAINLERLSAFFKKALVQCSDFEPVMQEYNASLIDQWDVCSKIANENIGGKFATDKGLVLPVRVTTPNNRINAQSGLFLFPLTF